MPAEKKKAYDYNGKKDIGGQGGGLNFITIVYIFRFAQKFNHRIAKQTLFDIFNKAKNGEKKCPYTHFFYRREDLFCQYYIADKAKGDKKWAVKKGKENRLDPERR